MRDHRNSRRDNGHLPAITIVGTGYVGLVTGACLAELGHTVVCADVDVHKIATLQAGELPFFEPGLPELVSRNAASRRLSFSADPQAAVRAAAIVYIAVGTPPLPDGHPDLSAVWDAAAAIGRSLEGPKIVVLKSTAPVGTCERIAEIIADVTTGEHHVDVVSNPEFLREGAAVAAFMHPDRIVIGTTCSHSEEAMRKLHAPLSAPLVITDTRTSEMIKYASNAFLAARISAINEIANICDAFGVDATTVRDGMAFDHRIGTQFLHPGLGYGGSCFPKDLRALERLAEDRGYHAILLRAVERLNEGQISRAVSKIDTALSGVFRKRVCVLGLAFKANTSDVRESPALRLIEVLLSMGAEVTAHDPVAMQNAKTAISRQIAYRSTALKAVLGADATIVATDWDEYRALDLNAVSKAMRGDLIFDGRNLLDPKIVTAHGLRYIGVGRSHSDDGASASAAYAESGV